MPSSTQPKPSPKKPQPNIFEGISVLGLVSTVAWQAAGPMLVLGIGGALLDRRLHTTPLLLLLGIAASVALSYVLVRDTVRRLQRHVDELVRQGVIKP
ncbi:MAG TPA: AtpZ/AtpI family protein [Candidatus Saccharimonadales bacterium]|nr:AtpZ/AtpI family protein [Candidatus Saccharimonadales bacterium]